MSASHDRNDYRSREWTEKELGLLAAHLTRARDETSLNWRSRFQELLAIESPECPHVQRHIIEIPTPYGVWVHEICAACGKSVRMQCGCVRLTWHHDGQALICDNCGKDGT